MKALFASSLVVFGICFTSPAWADIPTIDALQLDQHTKTSGTTVTLVPITTNRQSANGSVHCAVTTGKKAGVTNPTVQPQDGAGAQVIQSYSPSSPATPSTSATGGTLNDQTFFSSTGNVVGGLTASQSTLSATSSLFQSATPQVGTAPTIMGAFDMNTSARLQNGLVWNNAISAANLWVTTLNALNLSLTSGMSQVAAAMQSTASGSSAAASSISLCPTTIVGCVGTRTASSSGAISAFLAGVQAAAILTSSSTQH